VKIKDLDLKFRIYTDKGASLKQLILSKFSFKKNDVPVFREFYALKDVSLEFKEGDIIGLVGMNGAGKSTLLKAISRIYPVEDGALEIQGKVVPLLEIGAGFNPEFTGRENIYLNGSILGIKRKEMKQLEQEIIDFSELKDFMDLPVKYYSTGMYARLAFTIATSVKPEILILDEIFAGGDGQFVHKAMERMSKLIDDSKIVIIVSHSLDIIKNNCNRVIILDKGSVVADGPSKEIISKYEKEILKIDQ
jgi:ABC-type polysaccharide/polyol phosphate transport system ATPase subunit